MLSEDSPLFGIEKARKMLGVSRATLYLAVSSGELECFRIGAGRGTIRFTMEMLTRYLETKKGAIPKKVAPVPPRLKHLQL